MKTISFLDVDFSVAPAAHWHEVLLTSDPAAPLRLIVTPNVDHVVRLSEDAGLRAIYAAADYRICDSRILARLGRMRGIKLMTYPGSDMVRDLLADPRSALLPISVTGPDRANFERLCALFPGHRLIHVPAPIMAPGTEAWDTALAAVEASGAALHLLCLGFPKQEQFAADLVRRGAAGGHALCVGAAVDFLTGHQVRAPALMQKAGLEWLHRLASNPGRLWRRYLIEGPKVFALYRKLR